MRAARAGAAGMLLLALVGCSSGGPPESGGCVPLLVVTPSEVVAGGTITVSSATSCGIPIPDDGWRLTAAPIGQGVDPLVSVVTQEEFDGSFDVSLDIPADFPPGDSFVDVDNWDYSFCADTNASCAAASADFTVR